MPSAANAKSEKPASSEATDNSPIRQIITIIEHKIRNLEKRKVKLTQYRELQKAGKELKGDQKVAVAKYDEVTQNLEFARDISKQIASIATAAERDAKKQAKKDAWVRSATETSKIREVLLILDCLTQMGSEEAREDFLNGTNGAAKLTESDLKILDDLYPEVTPKHEVNEEGQPGFQAQSARAADHLCSIIDGKPKEVVGTTYAKIKEIVATVHQCGYFDRLDGPPVVEHSPPVEESPPPAEPVPAPAPVLAAPEPDAGVPPVYPVPPAPAVVPAPGYPLCPLPPITLQEVEHAYFAQQYPLQRPIAEVIGSQNFFFLQESEIDSPTGTPQPPAVPAQPSPGPIPTQTFTNQHFIVAAPRAEPAPPPQHFPAPPERAAYPGVPPPRVLAAPAPLPSHAAPAPAPLDRVEERARVSPVAKQDDDWAESGSPEREEGERRAQGQGDAQGRYRRYGRGRGAANGHRGRGYQARPADSYRREYQPRGKDDGYRPPRRDYRDSRPDYCGNGDAEEAREHHENGAHAYQGGFKGRGRGGARPRGSRPPRAHYAPGPRRHDAPAAAAE